MATAVFVAVGVVVVWVIAVTASGGRLSTGQALHGLGMLASAAAFAAFVTIFRIHSRSRVRRLASAKVTSDGSGLAVPLTLLAPALTSSAATTVIGRVAAGAVEPCPFAEGTCVAWRVTGRAPGGMIDDGRTFPFDLETRTGEVVRVDVSGGAWAMLSRVDATLHIVTPEQGAYLEERGAQVTLGEVALQVSVLRPGDSVAITGTLEERAAPEGFRGSRATRVLAAPLVIRHASAEEIAMRQGRPAERI